MAEMIALDIVKLIVFFFFQVMEKHYNCQSLHSAFGPGQWSWMLIKLWLSWQIQLIWLADDPQRDARVQWVGHTRNNRRVYAAAAVG